MRHGSQPTQANTGDGAKGRHEAASANEVDAEVVGSVRVQEPEMPSSVGGRGSQEKKSALALSLPRR